MAMLQTRNKKILTASSTETTLEPSGVLKVMKNKLQKSDHITVFLTGPNSDSLVLSTQAVSEEVSKYSPEIAATVTV